eukprot:CAMPEP_0204195804 /NCGR_PEP_ID=MMETSP0361-20130328/63364_1 /ASSEMBLY_ACC=CAM_ASM_000343 /TAXON_ID=268821 /ORGANISM="Scrippsiella Hangoei, Strain SHTV-5" /LENGTH=76 /DNA_ID=CAMNT_0051157441 /DNA_START=837 /DNA_END=1064 /DNA_ORIENTATION=+
MPGGGSWTSNAPRPPKSRKGRNRRPPPHISIHRASASSCTAMINASQSEGFSSDGINCSANSVCAVSAAGSQTGLL